MIFGIIVLAVEKGGVIGSDEDDGTDTPIIFGKSVEDCEYDSFVHYYDGTMKGFNKTKKI